MAAVRERPLSPHLTIWRWGPHMVVSILHRITGAGLSVVGLAVLAWWLMALAGSGDDYAAFQQHATSWYGLLVLAGLTWAFFQHTFSGLRHLLMDTGQGFELRANKAGAVATIVLGLFATALVWAYWSGALA
ncbi:succinate dehydrogenase, cytochrome b556 subunit [Sphingomonas sabuli]|uniref:Succinate dehydrogenase cytochrome b556 subunit n=1 Tax=Sphingomonas sabuli TaxID=2764186 RepID=A0A7G9L5F3_9SPHN|nr:succinate dehydrogenase, cytochrome b556 subunit [Sphingomonas sabuli]QNM83852.1 succinate dehydrogenase, cytochrome b556 subunit [Sphingomonas sabuli]